MQGGLIWMRSALLRRPRRTMSLAQRKGTSEGLSGQLAEDFGLPGATALIVG